MMKRFPPKRQRGFAATQNALAGCAMEEGSWSQPPSADQVTKKKGDQARELRKKMAEKSKKAPPTEKALQGVCKIVGKPCHYTGAPADEDGAANGVDRLDSSLPYTVENAVSCAFLPNMLKGELSETQLSTLTAQVLGVARASGGYTHDAAPAGAPAAANNEGD